MKQVHFDHNSGNVGFQIAPMIDVVFVIMLYFMVMAGSVKIEKELNSKLPGTIEASTETSNIDETIITVAENGEISVNDDPVDNAASIDLPQLKSTLLRLKEGSDAAKSQLVVTIVSEEAAKYSRTIDVLNACAYAKVSNVTFTISEED